MRRCRCAAPQISHQTLRRGSSRRRFTTTMNSGARGSTSRTPASYNCGVAGLSPMWRSGFVIFAADPGTVRLLWSAARAADVEVSSLQHADLRRLESRAESAEGRLVIEPLRHLRNALYYVLPHSYSTTGDLRVAMFFVVSYCADGRPRDPMPIGGTPRRDRPARVRADRDPRLDRQPAHLAACTADLACLLALHQRRAQARW